MFYNKYCINFYEICLEIRKVVEIKREFFQGFILKKIL